jgi:hypothetical protein
MSAAALPSIASRGKPTVVPQLRHRLYGAIEAAVQNRLEMLKVADCAKDPRLAAAS